MAGSKFTPNLDCWTIRFKYSRSTIFLHVLPESPFSSIKQALLNSINALPSTAQIVATLGTIPTDPEDIVFGVPVDKADLEQGWVPLFVDDDDDDDDADKDTDEENAKPKKGAAASDSVLNRHPRGAGLKDGSVLAFKFRSKQASEAEDGSWNVDIPRELEEGMEDEDARAEDGAP